jgi:hypothetical protein
MGAVIDFNRYRRKMTQARFFWKMNKCNYRELAQHYGVTHKMADDWIRIFIKELELAKEAQDAKQK